MSYIINPWAVYLIAQADRIRGFAWLFSIVFVVVCIAATITKHSLRLNGCDEKEKCEGCATCRDCGHKRGLRLARNVGVISGIIATVSVLILIFLPSTETLMYVAVAKAATIENLHMVKDQVKEAVDYIVSQVAALKG